jgi:hypothetical protein
MVQMFDHYTYVTNYSHMQYIMYMHEHTLQSCVRLWFYTVHKYIRYIRAYDTMQYALHVHAIHNVLLVTDDELHTRGS